MDDKLDTSITLETFIKDGKLFANTSNLKGYDKNPRDAKEEDILRLEKQITKLGQYKPTIVNSGKYWGEPGVMIGGNMRLKAFARLNLTEMWVSLVDPKNEAEFIEYSLSDNDRIGFYLGDKLANLLKDHVGEINFADYKADLSDTSSIDQILSNYQKMEEAVGQEEWVGMPEFENKEQTAHRQILISFQTDADVAQFAQLTGLSITADTKFAWYPPKERNSQVDLAYTTVDTADEPT